MKREYYAHTSPSRENETVIDHLRLTSKLAGMFGKVFGHELVCSQLGLSHDIGKFTEHFAKVLDHILCKQDHAIVAGIHYYNHGSVKNKWLRETMALIMASHHSCLYNTDTGFVARTFKESCLEDICGQRPTTNDEGKQITATPAEYNDICDYMKENGIVLDIPEDAYFDVSLMSANERMFYARILLSCLVDGDYCATAEYMNPGYLDKYVYSYRFDIDDYIHKLKIYRDKLLKHAENTVINTMRNEVYDACTKVGSTTDGFLTLTAPTGTGKTLALIQFALQNAKAFHRERIIIVLPYLSVIDQNSSIYADIFGNDVVLVDDSQTRYTDESRILSERWASPIIVTTSVNFFETLFACEAVNLRRLHSVANSVVVFDECQTLPATILNSSIEILQSLTKYYNTTVLFSTATKPSYEYRNKKYVITNEGSFVKRNIVVSDMQWQATEVMDDVVSLFDRYKKIKNTKIEACSKTDLFSCERLCEYFDQEIAAMYVFNTVAHANEMYQTVCEKYGEENCFIITSKFCAKDKLSIIDKVNDKLKKHEFVRLVATQCIEVGVDFDFVAGAREYAPLDSILQTLGRVNRNGLNNGKFLIFMFEKNGAYDYPSQSYKFASELSCELIGNQNNIDIYDVSLMDSYYRRLYTSANYSSDLEELYLAESKECYMDVSKHYHLIDNKAQNIIIVKPHTECDLSEYERLVKNIAEHDFSITKGMMRELAPYTISVYCNKNFDISRVATQLGFRKHDSYTNWYLLREDDYYTSHGFDKKVPDSNGVFL